MNHDTHKHYENFLEKTKEKFGDKFNYSKFIYVNAKTKGIIICPEHGEFIKTPEKHTDKKSHGCNKCFREYTKTLDRSYVIGKPIITEAIFLEKVNSKFNNRFIYNLNNYNGMTGNNISITCPEHGEFEMYPRAHLLSKGGCNNCSSIIKAKSNTNKYEDSMEVVRNIHNNKYIYPIENKDIYINKRTKIKIICPEHGEFIKSLQKHQSGQACFRCKVNEMVDNKILVGGYSHILFESDPSLKDKDAILYYLSINDGEFYKIGITTIDVKSRARSIKSKSKGSIRNYEILHTENMTLYEAFLKEQHLLDKHYSKRVFTKWTTELFSEDILN